MSRSDGLVDPEDVDEVGGVLAGVVRLMGTEGLGDLLGRFPGVRIQPAVAKGFLRPAVPAVAWVGSEDALALLPVVEHQQVVGGIVLHRRPLATGQLPGALAPMLVRLTREQAAQDEAAIVLSGARSALDG